MTIFSSFSKKSLSSHKFLSRAFTLAEVMISIAIISLILTAIYQMRSSSMTAYKVADKELQTQQKARRVLERLKNDIRAACWHEHLTGGKFIIQDPVHDENGNELGGARIKFAKFAGIDPDTGQPKIEKVMYVFDQSTGCIKRGNWEGPWSEKNDSPIINPHTIDYVSNKRDSPAGGYLYFREFYTDQDNKYGLIGRTFIYVGCRFRYVTEVGKKEDFTYDIHTIIGPRFINTRDKEPFWNQNTYSIVPVEEFEK